MADVRKALRKTLGHEGVKFDQDGKPIKDCTGYVNHPDDPGGETNYGITIGVARDFGYGGSIRDIPYEIVEAIYFIRYWDEFLGDKIDDQQIAEEMFDTAVNCGTGTVIEFVQRTLNVLNKKGTLYDDIPVDGRFGRKTLEALTKALAVEPWYRLCILRAIDSLQCVRYIELAEVEEKFETFMPGWLRNRVGVKE